MKSAFAIVAALFVLALLIVLAIYRQGPVIQADLGARVDARLAELDASHVRVLVDGQHLALQGSVTTPDRRKELLRAAAAVWGVVDVEDQMQVIAPGTGTEADPGADQLAAIDADALISPPDAAAEEPAAARGVTVTRDVGVTLTGEVESTNSRERLLLAVRSLHPGQAVEADISVASATPLAWNDLLRALELLRGVDQATVRLDAQGLHVSARSEDLAQAIAAREALQTAQLPIAAMNIDAPQVQRSVCQDLYNEMLAAESIRFASGSAAIEADSHVLLDRLVFALGVCDFAIEIGGHTDATGEAAVNLALSQQRADAVRDYLLASGVEVAIASRGYGAAQPVGDNATAAGRSANRRIEFNIRGPDASGP